MNNKVLIEEINRVREVMGLSKTEPTDSSKVILEVVSPQWVVKILRILNPSGQLGTLASKLVVRGGPIEAVLTKNDDFFWKIKNKYSDELSDVNTMDELLDRLIDAPNSVTTKNIMRDLFMDNPETRALISSAADNMSGGLGQLNNMSEIELFIMNMDELGIAIDADDLVRVADDLFKRADNPISLAIKNSGSVSKNLFGKPRKSKWLFGKTNTTTRIEKGSVIIDVMRDQGVKTSDDAADFMVKIGMSEADAAKVKVAIESGQVVGDDIAEKIFKQIGNTPNNDIQLAFIDKVSKNKYLKNKIQTSGASGGKMTNQEIRDLLNMPDAPDSLIMDISEEIGFKQVKHPFKRTEIGTDKWSVSNKGWYGTYIRKKIFAGASLGYKSVYNLLTVVYGALWLFHIIPFSMLTKVPEDSNWMLKWIFGTEGGGTFDCENNIQCVLKPTSENMSKVKRQEYVKAYLQNTDGVIDKLYLEAAVDIGKELGTFTDATGWFTEGSLETFSPPHSVSETNILDKLNERHSLFGVLRVATYYYDKTSRQLWDDCDLMALTEGSYLEFLSRKWEDKLGYFGIDVSDTDKQILNSLMSKPQRTILDTEIPTIDVDPRDMYNALFTFPPRLWLTKEDGDIETWKCCYKGPMPQQWTNKMTSAEEIQSQQDFKNMSPTNFNIAYAKYASKKYQTQDQAYMRPMVEKEVDGVKTKVYNLRGNTECGTPKQLEGMTFDEMKNKIDSDMTDFLDLLKNGNGGNPPVKDGEPNGS